MANQDHLDILKQGVKIWNEWREQHPEIQPNLRSTDLHEANLCWADLRWSDLSDANLSHANLSFSSLDHANLGFVNLRNADLSNANLTNTNLSGADLSHAKLTNTIVWETVFAHVDLCQVEGLAELDHQGPSRLELHTVLLPQDGSALHFLRGCGVPDEWIDFYRSTMMHPIQYYSVFISYSSKDEQLARRLHADLQDKGVRCWFAPHDLPIGAKTRPEVDKAIYLQEKLLLILSAASVASDWVEHEVETALKKERKEKRTVLFPIRIDRAILDQPAYGWPELVRNERNIGDFTHWTDPQAYQQAFERLVHDLKKADE